MNWKKIITKGLDALELVAQLGPSEEERKRDAMATAEATYDAAYYAGHMSKFSAEACKDAFRYNMGLDKQN